MSESQVSTTQDIVLQAIVKRLCDDSTNLNLNDSTCFLSMYPLPPELPSSDLFVTVAPGGGQFPAGLQEGGGQYTTGEEASVVVTVFSRATKLDRAGRSERVLTDNPRGLLHYKHKILKALASHDLQWEGDSILMNLIAVLSAEPPEEIKEERVVFLKLHFSTDFMWDLGTDE